VLTETATQLFPWVPKSEFKIVKKFKTISDSFIRVYWCNYSRGAAFAFTLDQEGESLINRCILHLNFCSMCNRSDCKRHPRIFHSCRQGHNFTTFTNRGNRIYDSCYLLPFPSPSKKQFLLQNDNVPVFSRIEYRQYFQICKIGNINHPSS